MIARHKMPFRRKMQNRTRCAKPDTHGVSGFFGVPDGKKTDFSKSFMVKSDTEKAGKTAVRCE